MSFLVEIGGSAEKILSYDPRGCHRARNGSGTSEQCFVLSLTIIDLWVAAFCGWMHIPWLLTGAFLTTARLFTYVS